MSTPQAKRRRLNEATKTLHKPFKSPIRTPLRSSLASDSPSSDLPRNNSTAILVVSETSFESNASGTSLAHIPTSASQPGPSLATLSGKGSSMQPPSRPTSCGSSRSLSKKGPTKPSVAREVMQLRNEIQILMQAQALATSNKDVDLTMLIDRWRVASRAVAEELFATTRDKVNRMGGVGAWKAREKDAKDRQRKWEQEEIEAERERLEEARENGEIGDEAYDRYADMAEENGQPELEEETFKAADDDSFTMDMMLKTLNIDVDLIGYNKEAQRWEG